MKSSIHDFNVTLVARIVQITTMLGAQSCMAWCLGTEGRGSYAVCTLFTLMLVLVFSLGCDIAVVYSVASKRLSVSEGVVNAVICGILSSILAIGVGVVLMQLPLAFFDKAARVSFWLALASIPLCLFSQMFTRLLTAVHLFRWFAIVSIVDGCCYLLLVVLFLRSYAWGVNGAIFALMLSSAVSTMLSVAVLWRTCTLSWVRPSLRGLVDILHYGARYYVGKLSNQVNYQVGTLILAFFATTSEVGLFAVAMRMVTQVMVIPDALTTVLMPRSAADAGGKGQLIAQCSRFTGLVCSIVLLLLAILARPLVNIVFSPAFARAVPLVQVLCAGVFVRCVSKVYVPYFLGTNRPGVASLSVAIGTAVNLLSMWILLPTVGLIGAAIGVTMSYFVSSFVLTRGFLRLTGLPVQAVLAVNKADWRLLVRTIRSSVRGWRRGPQFT